MTELPFIVSDNDINHDAKEVRVLCLNGGGSHVGVAIQVLKAFEEISGTSVNDYFDVVAGVSSGSILGAGLRLKGVDGKPLYSIDYMVKNFADLNTQFLKKKWYEKYNPLLGLIKPYCVDKYKAAALEGLFEQRKLGSIEKELHILATDVVRACPVYFSNKGGTNMIDAGEYLLKDVVGGSCAYPGAFGPVVFDSIDGKRKFALADGGVTSVNPAVLTAEIVQQKNPNARIRVLDLGLGNITSFSEKQLPFKWGEIQWGNKLNSLSLAVEAATYYSTYLASFLEPKNIEYTSIEPVFPKGFPGSFDVGPKVTRVITAFSEKFADENKDAIREYLARG